MQYHGLILTGEVLLALFHAGSEDAESLPVDWADWALKALWIADAAALPTAGFSCRLGAPLPSPLPPLAAFPNTSGRDAKYLCGGGRAKSARASVRRRTEG